MANSTRLDVSIEPSKSLERRMTVQVPVAQIEREVDARLAKLGKTAKLKGFRPGKVPGKVIRSRYAASVRQEVIGDVIRVSYSRAIDQEGLRPAGNPTIEPLPLNGATFAYRAVFEVYPEIQIKSLDALSVEKPVVEIVDKDVDEMIEKLRVQRSTWVGVDRPSAAGDRVTIAYSGTIDGEPFEGSEGKDVKIIVGEGQVIDDFDNALKGIAPGGHKTAKVKFPKDYPKSELAGKKAVFEISVSTVDERKLPELDEEFFEAFGVKEGGLATLRAEVRDNMQRELDERLRTETKTLVLDALFKANNISMPRALIDEEVSNLQAEAMRQMGIHDVSQAPDRSHYEQLAVRRVTLGLLVERLIVENDVELDRDRVDQRIAELASPYDKPDEAQRVYRTSRDLMAQVEASVLEDQVVDFVLQQAKTKAKKLDFKEFMNA